MHVSDANRSISVSKNIVRSNILDYTPFDWDTGYVRICHYTALRMIRIYLVDQIVDKDRILHVEYLEENAKLSEYRTDENLKYFQDMYTSFLLRYALGQHWMDCVQHFVNLLGAAQVDAELDRILKTEYDPEYYAMLMHRREELGYRAAPDLKL